MVFCNVKLDSSLEEEESHNPYFNRWFSAIGIIGEYRTDIQIVTILILIDGFLQW